MTDPSFTGWISECALPVCQNNDPQINIVDLPTPRSNLMDCSKIFKILSDSELFQ